MSGKRLNWRRVKINRSYTLEEVARLLGVHKQTVRNWAVQGLEILASQKPHLIRGAALRTFLDNRRKRAKQKCAVGQLYCFKCRKPQNPAADMLDYLPINLVTGNLSGICPVCGTIMFRRAALVNIDVVKGNCVLAFPHGQKRLVDSPQPSADCHLAAEALPDEKVQ